MLTTPLRANDSDDDLTSLADAVGVLKKLQFVATCHCGVILTDSTQVMCGRCATR